MLRIGVWSQESHGNDYVTNFQGLLGAFGRVETFSWLNGRYDVVVLAWTDNFFVNDSGVISLTGFIKQLAKVIFIRLVSRRVIFVRHNVVPHATKEKFVRVIGVMVSLYERLFDSVWVHSPCAADGQRRIYIPHPLYVGQDTGVALDISGIAETYVIFGRITKYKKIEDLFSCLPSGVRILVCGDAPDRDYFDQLKGMAPPAVSFLEGRLTNAEAFKILSMCKGVVIAHLDERMFVSGSLIFGLSAGARIFCVRSMYSEWLECQFKEGIIQADSMLELMQLLSQGVVFSSDGVAVDYCDKRDELFGDKAIREAMLCDFSRIGIM